MTRWSRKLVPVPPAAEHCFLGQVLSGLGPTGQTQRVAVNTSHVLFDPVERDGVEGVWRHRGLD